MITPFDFQRADIDNLLAHNATGFIVAETGAGKTVIAGATAVETGVPTKLIIAPQGTHKEVWRRTILELDPDAHVAKIEGTPTGKQAMDDLEWKRPGYYIVTPQLFTRWGFQSARPDLVIVDEAHLLGSRDTAGNRALKSLKRGGIMFASGTMLRNKFENFWPLLRIAYPTMNRPGEIADIAPNRWIERYCATETDFLSPSGIKVVGELNPGEIANLIPCYVQHFKREECCQWHPNGFLDGVAEPIVMRETVELNPVQKKAIASMETEYVAWLKDQAENDKIIHTKLPLERTLRLSQMTLGVPSVKDVMRWKADKETGERKQVAGKSLYFEKGFASPKRDRIMEIWEKNNRERMVVATNSLEWASTVADEWNGKGIRTFEWSSNSNQTKRDEALAAFKRGEIDIILGVTEAIGTGIDGLQDASSILVRANRSRDLTSEIQLEGRLDRRGQRAEGVLIYEIIAEGSTDEEIIGAQLKTRLRLNKSLRRRLNAEKKLAHAV